MALSFPASPVLNQIYEAEGTRFRWNGSYWLIVGTAASPYGDMDASVYDPTNIIDDAFDRGNHTGTQLAATISDFSTAVAATPAVTANTAKVTNATHTGDVTGDTVLTIANGVVTLAKQADVASGSVFYRKTVGTGAPEVQDLATLKTDLGLTGINSGDQTITLTGEVTGSGTGSFAATIAADAVTNVKLANMPTQTFKGRTTAGTGDPEDLTSAQATAMLDLAVGNGAKGLITLSAVNTATAAGTTFSDATVLTADQTRVTSGTGGVMLPVPVIGKFYTVINNTGATISIYPPTGGTIAGGAVNAGDSCNDTQVHIYICTDTLTLQRHRSVAFSGAVPQPLGTAATGTSRFVARNDHVHQLPVYAGGDVTGSTLVLTIANGAVTYDKLASNAVSDVKLADNGVSNAKLTDVATQTFKGRTTAGTGDPEDLTTAQATAMLDLFSSTLKGLVPPSGAGSTTFLRQDGVWTLPTAGAATLDVQDEGVSLTTSPIKFNFVGDGVTLSEPVTDEITITIPGTLSSLSDVNITAPVNGALLAYNTATSDWEDTGTFSSQFDTSLATKTTTNLTEGANLYYTDERVDDRVSALLVGGEDIVLTYNDVSNTLTIDGRYFAFGRTIAVHNLTSTTAAQKIIGTSVSPNGSVTLEIGTYRFYLYATVNAMSATSGNATVGITAGTATLGGVRVVSRGADAATVPAAGSFSTSSTLLSTSPAVVAAVSTSMVVEVEGWFVVTAAGTITPTIALTTAAAATVAAGAVFWVERIAKTTGGAIGAWS